MIPFGHYMLHVYTKIGTEKFIIATFHWEMNFSNITDGGKKVKN